MNNASPNAESKTKPKNSDTPANSESTKTNDTSEYEVPGDSYYTQYGDDELDMQRLLKK